MRNVECGVRNENLEPLNIEHPTSNSQHPVESGGHGVRGCCGWFSADTAAVRGRDVRREGASNCTRGRARSPGMERTGKKCPKWAGFIAWRRLTPHSVGFRRIPSLSGGRVLLESEVRREGFRSGKIEGAAGAAGSLRLACARISSLTLAWLRRRARGITVIENGGWRMAKKKQRISGWSIPTRNGGKSYALFRHFPPYSALFRLLVGGALFQSQVRCIGFENGKFHYLNGSIRRLLPPSVGFSRMAVRAGAQKPAVSRRSGPSVWWKGIRRDKAGARGAYNLLRFIDDARVHY